ncbi:MAG: sigma-70 family RNA polymerase sigma factor [Planctomycetota bacterium]
MSRFLDGHEQALVHLLNRYAPSVVAGLRIPRRWQAALSVEDVFQEACIDVALHAARFRPERGAFLPWLTSIARNRLRDALDLLEASKRGGGLRRLDDSRILRGELAGVVSSPSGRAARGERDDVLRAAITGLPEAYRAVVQLYDLEQRPIEEVARRLGRSTGAAFMLRSRAIEALRLSLGSGSRYLSR